MINTSGLESSSSESIGHSVQHLQEQQSSVTEKLQLHCQCLHVQKWTHDVPQSRPSDFRQVPLGHKTRLRAIFELRAAMQSLVNKPTTRHITDDLLESQVVASLFFPTTMAIFTITAKMKMTQIPSSKEHFGGREKTQ